jgi:hypothetical protein
MTNVPTHYLLIITRTTAATVELAANEKYSGEFVVTGRERAPPAEQVLTYENDDEVIYYGYRPDGE